MMLAHAEKIEGIEQAASMDLLKVGPGKRQQRPKWRKCRGIEPPVRTLTRRTIGFEDQAQHQSRKHFHAGVCKNSNQISRHAERNQLISAGHGASD